MPFGYSRSPWLKWPKPATKRNIGNRLPQWSANMASGCGVYEYHEPCRTDILPGWSVVNPGNAAASGGADSEFSPPNAGFWLSQKFWSGTWIRTEQTRKNNTKSLRTKQKFKALVQNIKTSEHTTLIKKMLSLWFSGRFGRFACLAFY